jgi:hypothetical protein
VVRNGGKTLWYDEMEMMAGIRIIEIEMTHNSSITMTMMRMTGELPPASPSEYLCAPC